MDRYSIKSLDDLVVPNYHESSSPDLWEGWAISSSEATKKDFMSNDCDMINNSFNGELYHSSSLHDFNGIQHMDDLFLTSILEDVPGNVNLHSFVEPSAEELVLQDLQRATENFTDETRKCFRNTFYRLAEKSQDSPHKSDSRRNTRQKTEIETNSIDRVIANLTFHKMESNLVKFPSPEPLASIH